MIDVVRETASFVKLDEVADDRDEILTRENGLARRPVRRQTLIDLVTANAAAVVALRREEEPLQRLLRCFAVGGVTRTKKRVDLAEGLLLGVSWILRKCVLDQRRFSSARGDEHLNLADLRLSQLPDQRIGELVAALGDDFTGVEIHRVTRDHAALRTLTALDSVHLVAEIDCRVRRKNLD